MAATLTPEEHTVSIIRNLTGIAAPWSRSHELYWNYREESEPIAEYINRAIQPLIGSGQVPILITSLDPANAEDNKTILEITQTTIPIITGQTILIRISLNSEKSIEPTANIMKRILEKCKEEKLMPMWWPLLQGELPLAGWKKLKKLLGSDWKYANLAINPFIDDKIIEEFRENIVVAQYMLGSSRDVRPNGDITVKPCTDTGLFPKERTYNTYEFAMRIKKYGLNPVVIFCGPSLPEWTQEENSNRVQKMLELYSKATRKPTACNF